MEVKNSTKIYSLSMCDYLKMIALLSNLAEGNTSLKYREHIEITFDNLEFV